MTVTISSCIDFFSATPLSLFAPHAVTQAQIGGFWRASEPQLRALGARLLRFLFAFRVEHVRR